MSSVVLVLEALLEALEKTGSVACFKRRKVFEMLKSMLTIIIIDQLSAASALALVIE